MLLNLHSTYIYICVHRQTWSAFFFKIYCSSFCSTNMDLNVYIQLIILCVLNIIFTFSGIVLNTLVVACFWKSSQLRKKLCHFMIMVLSCFDLVTVLTNHPGLLLFLISWLTEVDSDLFYKMKIYLHFSDAILGFSFHALLVMNIERYLGTHYPVYHRTKVTRAKLVALLATLLIFQVTLTVISVNNWLISYTVHLIIFFVIIIPPFIFINFKLFNISRNARKINERSPTKRTKNLKNVSTCLLAVACITFVFIPSIVFIALNILDKCTSNMVLIYTWGATTYTMNSTFNSLIFFWKNRVLQTEGMKILKQLKNRLVGS